MEFAGLFDFVDQFGQLRELSGSADDVDVGGSSLDELLVFLGHAPEDADDLVGVVFFVSSDSPEGAVDFVFGVLADATGVVQDDVGFFVRINQLIPAATECPHDQFAVEDVHLATDGFDVELWFHDLRATFVRSIFRATSFLSSVSDGDDCSDKKLVCVW